MGFVDVFKQITNNDTSCLNYNKIKKNEHARFITEQMTITDYENITQMWNDVSENFKILILELNKNNELKERIKRKNNIRKISLPELMERPKIIINNNTIEMLEFLYNSYKTGNVDDCYSIAMSNRIQTKLRGIQLQGICTEIKEINRYINMDTKNVKFLYSFLLKCNDSKVKELLEKCINNKLNINDSLFSRTYFVYVDIINALIVEGVY